MQKILDSTYFIGTLTTIFSKAVPTDNEGTAARVSLSSKQSKLDEFISQYEKEALIYLFGEKLASDFIVGIEQEEIEGKWAYMKSLVYSKDKKCPVANYVWVKLTQYSSYTQTNRGSIKEKIGSSIVSDDKGLFVRNYNDMIFLRNIIVIQLNENELFSDDNYIVPFRDEMNILGI